MEAKIQYFQSPVFGQIRVTVINDKPMFVANDVAAMLGYSNRSDAINRHCKGIVKHDVECVTGTYTDSNGIHHDTKQILGILFIPESDVYRLIMRSKIPEAEKFQDWVCEEILPAIRKTGGYMIAKADDTPEEIMARALLVAQDTMKRKDERIRQLEGKVETVIKENNKLRPKAEFMDKVMDADERIDIGQSAKILNLPFGRNTLFLKLRDMGVFFKNKNEPKQEYVKRGYFVLKEKWIDRNNHDGFMVLKVLVTQKGLEFLANLFKVVEQPKEMAEVI